jgi:aspartyl-tRNA(Asn)/glutamyl-tRNA(Gln) amidotransferase subunit A
MSDLSTMSAGALVEAYVAKTLSPVEVVKDALARIALHEPVVNAFTIVDSEGAMAAAKESEQRYARGEPLSPCDGVIATIKSNVATRGWHMRRGSTTIGYDAMTFDAPPTARLREAGCVLIGQTTMPEFGWIGATHSRLTGITRNPWGTDRTPGGSSGGAAAAAALGIGHFHVGSDGAGSIRIPASFSGLVGIMPGVGRVAAFPSSPFGILARLGPMTRSVGDAALMLRVMAAPDARDIAGMVVPAPDYVTEIERGIRGKRIAWSATLGWAQGLSPDVAEACQSIAHRLTEFGAIVEEADPGFSREEAYHPLRTLWDAGCAYVLNGVPSDKHGAVDEGFRRCAAAGAGLSATDILQALAARAALHEKMRAFHERYDLLLTPTMPTTAIEAGVEVPRDGSFGTQWFDWSPYTWPFNVTGQSAASVPVGLDAAGLPIGLQIVGPQGGEGLVLRCARGAELLAQFPLLSEPVIRH